MIDPNQFNAFHIFALFSNYDIGVNDNQIKIFEEKVNQIDSLFHQVPMNVIIAITRYILWRVANQLMGNNEVVN